MQFLKSWKTGVLLALAFAGTVQAGGCSDREIVTGIVAGAVGAAIASDVQRSSNCHTDYERQCWSVYDRWGNYAGRECGRSEVEHCGSHRRKVSFGSNSAADIDPVSLAETFKLSIPAAEKFVGVLRTAEAGDEKAAKDALASLCISVEDVKSAGNSGSLSTEKVNCMSTALNQDPRVVSAMVESLVQTARAQQAVHDQNHNN